MTREEIESKYSSKITPISNKIDALKKQIAALSSQIEKINEFKAKELQTISKNEEAITTL